MPTTARASRSLSRARTRTSPPPAFTYAILAGTGPSHGTLTGTAPNLTYQPNPGFYGQDSFTFTVTDANGTSSAAKVTLNVAVGTPTANAQSVSTPQGSAFAVNLTGSDDDTSALTYAIVSSQGPTNGIISNFNSSTGALTYTPNAGYSGTDSFEFTVNNGTNTSVPATVSINVIQATLATVSNSVGVTWGSAGVATLLTNSDGLRLLPSGRNTDIPWLGIKTLAITLSQAATLSPSDVTVTGLNIASYGPVTITGSGINYVLILAQPINAADRVTITIGNAGITTFTRRLDVLPGDFNDDGVVSSADSVSVNNATVAASYLVFADIAGDGSVDANDVKVVRSKVGTKLPPLV